VSAEAVLADVEGHPRLVITLTSAPTEKAYLCRANVRVNGAICDPDVVFLDQGSSYVVQTKTEIVPAEGATCLFPLLGDPKGTATFTLWGLGSYRTEGPLLTCKFAGDGLGHCDVDLSLAEGELRLTDRFTTDQSCIRLFADALQKMGQDAH
jgi:hypothetical protein